MDDGVEAGARPDGLDDGVKVRVEDGVDSET